MPKCTIHLTDEVNVKFEGLDLDLRKRLTNQFKKEIPHARYMPAVRLGRWDGKKAFFNLGGTTYRHLLDQILPLIDQAGYDIELNDQRGYITHFDFEPVTETTFQHAVWPPGHPAQGQPILFREHQVTVINDFLKHPQSLQEVATGAGKTMITAALSHMCESHGRTIVIVPNKSLVTQTERDYQLLGLDVGVWFGDRKEADHQHVICTWQSLNILLKNAKNQILAESNESLTINEFIQGVVAVIVDECFAGHSRVLTPSGWIPIKDILPGDQVINYDEILEKFKIDTVIKQHQNLANSSSEKMYRMEFDNNKVIEVTGNHKFLTQKGWVRADELTEEHEILSHDTQSKNTSAHKEKSTKLIKKTEIEKPEIVYNLHVRDNHNYIVEGAVVSNCHQAKADALTELLTGPMAQIPIRWGLTGTIPKIEYEWMSLLVAIGPVVNRLAAVELQEKGILSQCHVNICQLIDHGEYRDYQSELKYLVDNADRMTHIAQMIQKISESGNTLVLVDRLAAGEHLCRALPAAVFISGKDRVKDRKDHYDTMAVNNNLITVATYGVAAVGIDIPRLFNVVLIEPGKSFVRTIQSIGRGLRKAQDKDSVQIWDITSTMKFSKRHLSQRKKFYSEAEYPYSVEKIDW